MTIPGSAEPGAIPEPQNVQLQRAGYLSSAIPIKKRRYPVVGSLSPTLEKSFDASGSTEQKSNLDGGLCASDTEKSDLVGNSDVRKVPPFILKRVEVGTTKEEFRCTNLGLLLGKKALVSLGADACLRNRMNILSNENLMVPGTTERCGTVEAANVKQEIGTEQAECASRASFLTSPVNVELSLEPKETQVSALECQKIEAVDVRPRILDPSLLTLGSAREKVIVHDNSSEGSANRSNWDLNITMDACKGSTDDGVSIPGPVDIHGFNKSDDCSDVVVPFTGTGNVGLHVDKGNDSLGLRLATQDTELNSGRNCPLIDKSTSTNCSLHLNLKEAKLSSVNVNGTVKSEPVDENVKLGCSLGSCSSSNIGLSKFDSVKRELVDSNSLKIALQSSDSPHKSDGCRSIVSEAVKVNQEASKSDDAIQPQTVAGRVIQDQESCASSSVLPAPLTPQKSCTSRLPTCSELTMSRDISNQSLLSLHSKVFNDHNDNLDSVNTDKKHLTLCDVGHSGLEDPHESNLARVDECAYELCHSWDVSVDGEEKMNISTEMFEENSFGSDSESKEYPAIGITKDGGENMSDKNEEEVEDREAPEHLGHSEGKDLDVEGKKTENLELIDCGNQNLQSSVSLGDQSINVPSSKEMTTKENHEDTQKDASYSHHSDDKTVQKQKRSNNVAPHGCSGVSGMKDVGRDPVRRVSRDWLTNGSSVMDNELGNTATNKSGKEICLRGNDGKDPAESVSRDRPTNESSAIASKLGNKAVNKMDVGGCSRGNDLKLPKAGASLKWHDAAGGCDGVGNKSRIIKLPGNYTVQSSGEMRSIANFVPMSRRGKRRYSNHDGNIHPQLNRHEFYSGDSNKNARDKGRGWFKRNPRPSFMHGKRRKFGRFDQVHGECESSCDFTPENCTGPSGYPISYRQASNISDIESECNDYGIEQDGTALLHSRREAINAEFSSLHHMSRRLSHGDRDRSIPMLHGIPRNMSPSQCSIEDGSKVIGHKHDDGFMLHLSDYNIFDPNCNSRQVGYNDLDSLFLPGSRDLSVVHLNGYRRMRSRSPIRLCTQSPHPQQSPRRRSPNRLPPELTDHGSPALYRMGRMRSHDRACFRDKYIGRRQESPSFITRHPNNLREVDSGLEHDHPRFLNSDRRGLPSRVFPSCPRREALDSQDPSDKFNEPNVYDRRTSGERWRPFHSIHPNYTGDIDDFNFHGADDPRPYRLCPGEEEFVDISNMEGREFNKRIKLQPLVLPRQVKNIKEQEYISYRPSKQAWHDYGFTKTTSKRRY